MQHLVPIKVKIGLRPNGHADHPDWTLGFMIKAPVIKMIHLILHLECNGEC